jgi:tetratricopeptide (TPR) repeat protein
LAQDAARRLEAITTDAATRDLLIAESQATLRPALADRDYKRRGAALQLISRLPEQWVEEAWRREVLATAEQLLQTFEWNEKHGAIRAIHRFAEDGNDRIFAIFTNDPDDAVIQAAYRMLGDEAFPRVEEQLRSALQLGDVVVAQRLAPLVRIHGRERTDGRELAGKWLDDGSCAQCAAAFLTLAALYGDYEREEDWVDLFKRARIAFQRHGTEEIWQRISTSIKSLDESRRAFIYQILYTLDESLDRLVFFLAELWPDDIEILAISAGVDIQRGRRAEASERLDSLQALFPERISRTWLAARYAELDRPQDALRHLRLAVDRDPTSAEAHFAVGWYAFIVGEFEASIASTQRSVELQPTNAMAYFNLGLALLAQQDVAAAEATYRRGLAFVRRQAQADARSLLDDALGDFPRLPELPDATKDAVERIRSSLRATRDRLETGCETHQLQWPDRRKQAPH